MRFQHSLLAQGSPLTVMAELYSSEINCSISSFWDGGWTVKLGDEINGSAAEATFDAVGCEAGTWLAKQACKHYPDSLFRLTYMASLGRVEIIGDDAA